MTRSICLYFLLILSAGHFSCFDTRSGPTRVYGRIVDSRTGDPVDGYKLDLFKGEHSFNFFGGYDQIYVKSFSTGPKGWFQVDFDAERDFDYDFMPSRKYGSYFDPQDSLYLEFIATHELFHRRGIPKGEVTRSDAKVDPFATLVVNITDTSSGELIGFFEFPIEHHGFGIPRSELHEFMLQDTSLVFHYGVYNDTLSLYINFWDQIQNMDTYFTQRIVFREEDTVFLDLVY